MGHGVRYHAEGFGSPVGKLKGINLAIEDMSPRDLKAYNIYEGKTVTLEFEGGVRVTGEIITGTRNLQGKIILISFRNCTVTYEGEVLFEPAWGIYDMAVGKKVVSAFSGPADVKSFDLITHVPSEQTIRVKKTEEERALEALYQKVRDIRNGKEITTVIPAIFESLKKNYPNDWLLAVELYELAQDTGDDTLAAEIRTYLEALGSHLPGVAHLIDGGIGLVDNNLVR